MRYLSVNSSGIWRFRFQIPPTHQHLFSGRSELKRSFGKVPSEVAQIKALELEAHARRVMSGMQFNPDNVCDELIESELRTLVRIGKRKVADGVSTLSRSPELKMQLRGLQEELTASHLAGGQVLNWGAFPALAWVNDIYPGTDSPAQKSDQWFVEAGVTPKSMYVYHLTNFFELTRAAQKAFLLADLKTVKMILSRLEMLSDASYQLGTAVVADALVEQVQQPKKKSRSKYNLQRALKAYQEDKRIIRGINSKSNSSTKIESELRREEGRCRVVHKLVGIDDITMVSRKDVTKAIELLRQFPVVPHQSKFRTRFDKLPLEKWNDLGRELGLKTLSHRTVFAYVSAASAFYEWANRHIDSQIGNLIGYHPCTSSSELYLNGKVVQHYL